MAEHTPFALQLQGAGVLQHLQMSGLGKAWSSQKVAIARHPKQGAMRSKLGQGVQALALKRCAVIIEHIVADPNLKQVTQHKDGLSGRVLQTLKKSLRERRL
jgi:hypothetical protein